MTNVTQRIKQKFSRLATWQKWLLVAGVAVLLAVVAYVATSALYWSAYQASLDRAVQAQEGAIKRSGDILADEKVSWGDKQSQINDLIRPARDLICDTSVAYRWQVAVLPRLKQVNQHCLEAVDEVEGIDGKLAGISDFIADVSAINSIISPLSKLPAKQRAKDWAETRDSWRSAASDLEAIDIQSSQLGDFHSDIASRTASIASNWQRLIQADKDKDSDQFRKAEAALESDYKQLSKLTVDSLPDIDLASTGSIIVD